MDFGDPQQITKSVQNRTFGPRLAQVPPKMRKNMICEALEKRTVFLMVVFMVFGMIFSWFFNDLFMFISLLFRACFLELFLLFSIVFRTAQNLKTLKIHCFKYSILH